MNETGANDKIIFNVLRRSNRTMFTLWAFEMNWQQVAGYYWLLRDRGIVEGELIFLNPFTPPPCSFLKLTPSLTRFCYVEDIEKISHIDLNIII